MKKKTAIVLAALAGGSLLLTPLQGQGLRLKGQLWGTATWGNDPAPERENVEETIGYIPTFSLERKFGPLSGVDLEFAYHLNAVLDGALEHGEADINRYSKLYRLWGRFATEKLELRLGLQKIAFGPGIVLRPLIWFDTWDITDPTGQTEGVGALRLKWYPHPRLASWVWAIRPDHLNKAMLGGRVEYTFGPGEVALTYYHHKTNDLDFTPKPLLPFDSAENRLALDARLDWKVGLWTEMMLARGPELEHDNKYNELVQIMIGGDYTLPWGQGVYVMMEHLWSRMDAFTGSPNSYIVTRKLRNEQFTVLMLSIPWGFFDSFMGLVQYDWENERLYNFLMWQRTYDNFSLHTILYANPRREDYFIDGFPTPLPESLMGFGNGIQFMIVYNH